MNIIVRLYNIHSPNDFTIAIKEGDSPYPLLSDDDYANYGTYSGGTTQIEISGHTFELEKMYWIRLIDNFVHNIDPKRGYIVENIYIDSDTSYDVEVNTLFLYIGNEGEDPTPSITPTPTATPVVFRLHRSSSGTSGSTLCCSEELDLYDLYTDVTTLLIGTTVYIDSALLIPFNGQNSWWRLNYIILGDEDYCCLINNDGEIEDIAICINPSQSPTPTPTISITSTPTSSITPTITPTLSITPSSTFNLLPLTRYCYNVLYACGDTLHCESPDYTSCASITYWDELGNEYTDTDICLDNYPDGYNVMSSSAPITTGLSLIVCPTPTPTPSITPTTSPTPTISITPTITPTISPTPTISVTPTITPSITPTITVTPTITPSITSTITVTPTMSITPTQTPSITPPPSNTPTPSPTPVIIKTVFIHIPNI